MKGKKIAAICGMITALLIPASVSAGSINGNEQSILGVVQGNFEYDGVTYKAAPGYVEKARSYLAADDVDLDEAQASEAIATIYANVEAGISEGYIIPVTDSQPVAADEEKDKKEKTDKKDDKASKETKKSKKAKNAKKEAKADAETTYEAEEAEAPKKVVVVSMSSGSVEALDAEGNSLFLSESVIKDTGYHFEGTAIAAAILVLGIGIGIILIKKYNLLARYEES